MQNSDNKLLDIVAVPAVILLLVKAEKEKGSPLTKEEVQSINENATSIALPRGLKEVRDKTRGYEDVGFETAWEDWVQYKKNLADYLLKAKK